MTRPIRNQPGAWKRAADTFNRAGEHGQKAGIQFAYHNHHFEFVPVEGKKPLDLILETCDPELVKIELDLCWAAAAGQDPVAWFQKYPGRFPMVHVKGLKQASAGRGEVDRRAADRGAAAGRHRRRARPDRLGAHLRAREGAPGSQHYFVEHDQPTSPFDSLASGEVS